MDLRSVIASFNTGIYTVHRPDASTYSQGRLDSPAFTDFTIEACVQPVSGHELRRLLQGFDASEVKAVWTDTQLLTQTLTNGPDLIVIGSETYQVHKVENWGILGAYYKALVTLT